MKNNRIISLMLSLILLLSSFTAFVFAEEEEVTESATYVLDRNANGEKLYFYQSPCNTDYTLNGTTSWIQAFVYTMYNSVNGDHIPSYCCDIDTGAYLGKKYRRQNLEDSTFSANAAGLVRAILMEGFYLIPIEGESNDDHAARVAAKTAEMARASGAEGLTTGEAIMATQAAIWQVIHGSDLSFPRFCRPSLGKPGYQVKYADLCSYNELSVKDNALINSTIETVFNYLVSLDPIESAEKTVSASSFVKLDDPSLTRNEDGSYDISVTATVDVQMVAGDTLSVKASLNGMYVSKVNLVNGEQVVTLTLDDVPASVADGDITLSVSGYQTATGFFYFDAEGERGTSQSMVGYDNSRLPVYAEVTAKKDRVLSIYKSANVPVGNDSFENKPLANISFDIFPVATKEEYESGAVILPKPTEYKYPAKADYILTTDKNGTASLNFLHNNLPDGIYLVVEHAHPSIVAPIEPFYVQVPGIDPETGETLYTVELKPKNDVKGGVHIDKDVISVGNNEASVDAYEPHQWIIGTTVPEDIGAGMSYVITDTLDNRLDYLGNLSVVLESAGEEEDVTLAADTDYTLTVTDVDSLAEDKPSDGIKIELTVSGMVKISDTIGSGNFNSYMLRVYFDACINANAEMGTRIPNKAVLEYVNAVNFEFVEKSDIPVVYTGGVNLLKIETNNASQTLSGAVFEVYRPATEAELLEDAAGLTEIDGFSGKVIKVSFYDNPELRGDKVMSVTSGEDGIASVYGLAFGKYFVVETKAPAGYNAMGGSVELTVDEVSHIRENAILVENSTGVILPSTGNMGTTVFIIIGIAIMCGAGILLCANKYRE